MTDKHDDMPNDDLPIKVRTFSTIQEIWSVKGFKHDYPINEQTYKKIIGDYWFPEKVKCCRLKKSTGLLCKQEHNWGFVALLKDGTITIVGNCCARDKFGADSTMKADRSKYLNEKKRQDSLFQLNNLVSKKVEILEIVETLRNELSTVQNRTKEFSSQLGDQTYKSIQNINRTGNSTITITSVKYHEYIDEDGEEQKEKRTEPIRLGTLNGTSIFIDSTYNSIFSSLSEIENALANATMLSEESKTSTINKVVNAINDHERIKSEINKIKKNEELFYKNDLTLLCFLVDDKKERYNTARTLLKRAGKSASKEKAKLWLAEKEQEMKKVLKADKLEIR